MPPTELAQKFNALPRKPKTPSGFVANDWHFDIRFVPLEPNPAHVLFLLQPASNYVHLEYLPLGSRDGLNRPEFFPESAEEAAQEIARALLHSFVDNMGLHKFQAMPPPPFAPWALTTEEPGLAKAVGEELESMGVSAKGLLTVSISARNVIADATKAFGNIFQRICANPIIPPSEAIMFRTQTPARSQSRTHEAMIEFATEYYQLKENMSPPRENIDKRNPFDYQKLQATMANLQTHLTTDVKTRAEQGDPEATFDYALRLQVGYQCTHDPVLVRKYLLEVIGTPTSSTDYKSAAHAILSDWYVKRGSNPIFSRYFYMACHHAEAAIRIAEAVSPRDYTASPSVLFFLANVYRKLSTEWDAPEALVMYKRCYHALKLRDAQVSGKQRKAEVKRLKQPNRYRCANSGCGIVADKGRMFSRCAGKCDADKKPSYCGKVCQKADWQNHKPFCKPDMPCSVIDDEEPLALPLASGTNGSIGIRVGERVLSSSTMSAEELRSIRDAVSGEGGLGNTSLNRASVERWEI